ncbi:arsenate reductase/protein-tyrosine-phosphatase family protein [Brachybacterium sp. AOP25-B2-12]|uniref:arsenate reductase/protein-tyrosine-phosphatase family protein n=1 Tax=Brachybacterium sp. AOP25-B2-12 TaxID=3457710 RepID=UPI0040347662
MTSPGGEPIADIPIASVLFVCTGNVCRSPFGAALLEHLVPGLAVSSAGTDAWEGSAMDPLMATQLGAGVQVPADRTARQVTLADLDADLILVMSRRQRGLLLDEHPGAVRRLGLLGSVATLCAPAPGTEAWSPLTRGDVARWTRLPVDPAGEIADPFRRGEQAAHAAAQRITTAVELLAPRLAGAGPR